ncbi:MAG: hypothetical protein MJ252_13870 [archaeon]|nr:hypothetical protein [archaeon]
MSDPKKKLDITAPMGLNLDDFGGNFNVMNSTIHKISQSNDVPIINELSNDHKSIKEILAKRKAALQSLSKLWVKGNIPEVVQPVSQVKDLGVATDFFNYAFMQNNINKDYLKPEQCIYFLPIVTSLINSKYETNFRVGIKMVCMMFDLYSNNIEMAYKSQNFPNEKTKQTYESLIKFFDEITKNQRVLGRDLEKDKNLKALIEEMRDFCKKCRKKD